MTNDMFQPWRALTTIINLFLTGKTSGFERPRAPVLKILWGVVNRAHIVYAERIWEEFTQSIHTFIEGKKNLTQRAHGKKKATFIVIPSIRFTNLIIYYLQRKHKFHPRLDSPLHLPNEKPILGYLNSLRSVGEPVDEGILEKEPRFDDEEEVKGKGKEKVIDEQVALALLTLQTPKKKSPADQFIFQRRTFTPTESSSHDESSSLYVELGLADSEVEYDEDVPRIDVEVQDEGQARLNPSEQDEGQAGPNLGDDAASQPQSSPIVHAGPNLKHMDLEAMDVSTQPHPEQMDEGFTATAYPKVQENLKLTVEEQDMGGPSITPLLLPEDVSVWSETYSSYQDTRVEIRTVSW
nr:hypothetical protein [Tanacetum cinerariifolium]